MADDAPCPQEDELVSRPPREADLVAICKRLNELGARYLVCGGFAIMQAGYPRFTGDIDLLVDASAENESKIFAALEILPDGAIRELDAGDLEKFGVCRVADEVLVDLMASASGIAYTDAAGEVVTRKVQGVEIPFASPALLWRMKSRSHREKDRLDVMFLRQLFEREGILPPG